MKTSVVVGIAAGAAILGLLIGMGLGGSDDTALTEQASMQEELKAQVSALDERLVAIEGRFDGLSEEIGSLASGIEGQSENFAAVSDRIGEISDTVSGAVSSLSEDFSGRVSTLSEDISGTLSEKFGGLSSQLAAFRSAAPQGGESVSGEMVSPGETLMLGDGAARVFLSAVSSDSQSARVAINGTGLQTLRVGRSVEIDGCQITLTGIEAPSAMIDGSCGGGGGEGGDASAQAAASEPAGLGAGTEVSIATSAALADGAVRVYLSQFDPSTGTARIAINGTDLTVLAVGESAQAGDCTVSLTGMADTSVSLDASCD